MGVLIEMNFISKSIYTVLPRNQGHPFARLQQNKMSHVVIKYMTFVTVGMSAWNFEII